MCRILINHVYVGYSGSIAGGQPGDEVGAWVLLPKAAALLQIPVVAAGACATGRQLAAALAMGAPIRDEIKRALASDEYDERSTTVVMQPLRNATRVFKNAVSLAINAKLAVPKPDFAEIVELATGQRTRKMWQENGRVLDAMWSCGQSVGLIDDVPTCKALIERMVAEAEEQLTLGVSRSVKSSKL